MLNTGLSMNFIFLIGLYLPYGTAEVNKNKTSPIEEYLHPDFYWPLDYSSWIREVIHSKTSVVTENDEIGIKGSNPGYLQFPVQLASAKLGTFESQCLGNIKECKTGISIGLWIKLENVGKNDNNFKLLWTRHDNTKGDKNEEPNVQIRFSVNKGTVMLKVLLSHEKIEDAETPITAGIWYHVIVQYSNLSGMKVFINTKMLTTTSKSGSPQANRKNVIIMLGKDPKQQDGGTILRHENIVSVDNLAIWERMLSVEEIRKIYLIEFGTINILSHTQCRNANQQFEVKWYKPNDYYKHIKLYTLYWWTGNVSRNNAYKVTYPAALASNNKHREIKIRLDVFERNKVYDILVEADTKGGISLNSHIKCNSRNVAGGTLLRAFSRSPFSIIVTWKQNGQKQPVYFISYVPVTGGGVVNKTIQESRLTYTMLNLLPNTRYDIRIQKNETGTGVNVFYRGIHKTIPIASTLNTSVVSTDVVFVTWNSFKIKFHLHLQLAFYPMLYNISQQNLDNPQEKIKYLPFHNITRKSALNLQGNRMHENTTYAFNVEVSDEGVYEPGPKMKQSLVIKTKVRFNPPDSIVVRNASANQLILSVVLPKEASDNNFGITHLKVEYQWQSSKLTELIPIHLSNNIVLNNLTQFTVYTISVSTGDGNVFGKEKRTISLKTADDNECNRNDSCGINSLCINTLGSYICKCKTGFHHDENKTCVDNNECLIAGRCGVKMVCVNIPGYYKCECISGFDLRKESCEDINECLLNDTCIENAFCVNTIGSFECRCKNGYVLFKDGCIDVNECSTNNTCPENSNCINSIGSYHCECKPGFLSQEKICTDVNECLNNRTCDTNASCTNTQGSYECLCKRGFQMDSGKCIDVDECLPNIACNKNENCINMLGSYTCECKTGFTFQNGVCTVTNPPKKKDTCEGIFLRNVYWPSTKVGKIASSSCPIGTSGNAFRACVKGQNSEAVWDESDLSECVSIEWIKIRDMQKNDTNVIEVATSINTILSEGKKIYGGDVRNIINLLDAIATSNEHENATTTELTDTMVNITSTLLDKKSIEAWKDVPQEKRSSDAARLLETSDSVVEASAKDLPMNKTTRTIVTENIVMRLQRLSTSEDKASFKITTDNSIELPADAITSDSGSVTVATVTYTGLSDLIGVPENTTLHTKGKNLTMNSEVMSISVFPQQGKTFSKPVVMVQKLSQHTNNTEPNCVYWQMSDEGSGYWSDSGCLVHKHNKTHVTCHCYHLTNFAVLMSATDAADQLSGAHQLALSLITTVGISISLVALVASFFTFVFIRAIHSFRNTIHQHLTIALFLAQIIFLFGIERTDSKVGCQMIAALLHYFFLASFFIMGLEGIVLYLMLVRVYRSMGTSGYGSTKYVILCWVLPLVFLMINLFLDDHAYGANRSFCWLSLKHGFIWSFIGPALLVVVANFVILIMTLRIMSQKAKKRSTASDEIWFWTKGCGLLLCILGVTWVIGIFYIDMNTIFAAYIFNIFNSLQGLSVYIFHCICDPRVRKAYYNFFCCVRYKQTLIRSNSRTRTTSTGSKSSLKRKSKRKYKMNGDKEHVPLYLNGANPDFSGNSSSPSNSFGVLVGTNNF